RASLGSLLLEPDFSLASFLLSVLGEGSFLALLAFLDRHAPDRVTRQVVRLARVDEARHVAFGVAHLEHQAALDVTLRGRPRGSLVGTGALATALACVATPTVAAAGSATGISLDVGGAPIPVLGFATLTAFFSLIGVILAVAMARVARRPRSTFVRTTVLLT